MVFAKLRISKAPSCLKTQFLDKQFKVYPKITFFFKEST